MTTSSVRRLASILLLTATAAVACKEDQGAFVPVATSIVVTPSTKAFHALTAQQQFSAQVKDQNGDDMTSAGLSWSTDNATVATVNGSGLVTAQGVGSANIKATVGSVVGQSAVTVTQVAASLFKFDGDAQSGTVGHQLSLLVTARVLDSANAPMPGATVNFAAGSGGSVGAPSATSNALGQASTTWTLGSTVGAQQLTASATGLTSVIFGATALALAADTVIKQTADATNVPAGTLVNPAPSVLVKDSLGNPVSGVMVTFAITAGGGLLTGAAPLTNASGMATVGSWTVGASGAQTLTATVTGAGIGGNPITFNATVLAPGAPATIAVFAGNNQQGLQGYAVNIAPAAIVKDASNNPVQGASVTFTVQTGGGSVTGGTANTDLTGVARVGSWTILAGSNTLDATVSGVGAPATFSATGVTSAFNIAFRFLKPVTPTQQSAFDSAAARWSRAIIGDLPDIGLSVPANACSAGVPPTTGNENVDDVLIYVLLDSIDGPFNILGSAGPCGIRTTGGLQPFLGLMRFDTADVALMISNGSFRSVILHEMGHVLGLGTRWQALGLLTGAGSSDPFFTGTQARAQFDANGGAGYSAGGKVPVENCIGTPPGCGAGTRDGHWRETTLTNELMTGYINAGPNPLSTITIAQYADLNYQVNLAEADAFTLPFSLALRAATPSMPLGNDILRLPMLMVDDKGRIVGVLKP